MTGDMTLLLRALAARTPSEGEADWRQWYESVDFDQVPWESMQIIPALGARLNEWLRDDPAAGIVHGIVRRSWTEAQVRLAAAQDAAGALTRAGCDRVLLAGPPAISLLNPREGSVRPITVIRLLVPRERIYVAVETLDAAGWTLDRSMPPEDALDWVTNVYFSRQGVGLQLHWRLLDVPPERAAACESEFLRNFQRVDYCGRPAVVPAPEHALLMALGGRTDPDPDSVPWQLDAVLLPLEGINWPKWSALAALYAPQAFDRLEEMGRFGLNPPRLKRPAPPPAPARTQPAPQPPRGLLRRIYRTWRARAGRLARRYLFT